MLDLPGITEVLGRHAAARKLELPRDRIGDIVVTSGNFLIAAESRIRSAATYWEGGDAPQ